MYLLTSSGKMIHRDLELLTITSYTAVGSGFDPQGVPAEKPTENIYWDLKWSTSTLSLHILIMATKKKFKK